MNASIKIYVYAALICFSFWMLTELRSFIGKASPRLYFALGLISIVLSASASIPWAIAFISGKIVNPLNPSYIIYIVISFSALAYTLVRMIVFVSARDIVEKLDGQTYSDEEENDNKEF